MYLYVFIAVKIEVFFYVLSGFVKHSSLRFCCLINCEITEGPRRFRKYDEILRFLQGNLSFISTYFVTAVNMVTSVQSCNTLKITDLWKRTSDVKLFVRVSIA